MKGFLIGFLMVLGVCLFSTHGYGEVWFDLEQVAVSKIPKDKVFSIFISLAIDKNGNVFCVSRKESVIVKFDPNLNYVTTFSRPGKGPGDISVESFNDCKDRISFDENNNVYFFDNTPGRLVIFDNNGKYIKDINIQRDNIKNFNYIWQVRAVTSNYFTGKIDKVKQEKIESEYVFFQLSPFTTKIRYPFNEKTFELSHKGSYVTGTSDFSVGRNMKFVSDFEKMVFMESQRYRIYVYDLKGKKLTEIIDTNKNMGNFSNKEIEALEILLTERSEISYDKLKMANPGAFKKLLELLKDKKNVIGDIKLTEKKIVVFPVSDDISVNDKFPMVVYDLKGNMLKKGFIKRVPVALWKNYAYTMDNDGDDNPVIYKYRIKNF